MAQPNVIQTIFYGGRSINVAEGFLHDFPSAECIVNSTDGELNYTDETAFDIMMAAGGETFRKECREIVRRYGKVPLGGAVITTAGKLPHSNWIIHVVGPDCRSGGAEEVIHRAKYLRMAIWSCMKTAEEKASLSVALPALGCGAQGYPEQESCEVTVATIKEYFNNNRESGINEVYLVARPKMDQQKHVHSDITKHFNRYATQLLICNDSSASTGRGSNKTRRTRLVMSVPSKIDNPWKKPLEEATTRSKTPILEPAKARRNPSVEVPRWSEQAPPRFHDARNKKFVEVSPTGAERTMASCACAELSEMTPAYGKQGMQSPRIETRRKNPAKEMSRQGPSSMKTSHMRLGEQGVQIHGSIEMKQGDETLEWYHLMKVVPEPNMKNVGKNLRDMLSSLKHRKKFKSGSMLWRRSRYRRRRLRRQARVSEGKHVHSDPSFSKLHCVKSRPCDPCASTNTAIFLEERSMSQDPKRGKEGSGITEESEVVSARPECLVSCVDARTCIHCSHRQTQDGSPTHDRAEAHPVNYTRETARHSPKFVNSFDVQIEGIRARFMSEEGRAEVGTQTHGNHPGYQRLHCTTTSPELHAMKTGTKISPHDQWPIDVSDRGRSNGWIYRKEKNKVQRQDQEQVIGLAGLVAMQTSKSAPTFAVLDRPMDVPTGDVYQLKTRSSRPILQDSVPEHSKPQSIKHYFPKFASKDEVIMKSMFSTPGNMDTNTNILQSDTSNTDIAREHLRQVSPVPASGHRYASENDSLNLKRVHTESSDLVSHKEENIAGNDEASKFRCVYSDHSSMLRDDSYSDNMTRSESLSHMTCTDHRTGRLSLAHRSSKQKSVSDSEVMAKILMFQPEQKPNICKTEETSSYTNSKKSECHFLANKTGVLKEHLCPRNVQGHFGDGKYGMAIYEDEGRGVMREASLLSTDTYHDFLSCDENIETPRVELISINSAQDARKTIRKSNAPTFFPPGIEIKCNQPIHKNKATHKQDSGDRKLLLAPCGCVLRATSGCAYCATTNKAYTRNTQRSDQDNSTEHVNATEYNWNRSCPMNTYHPGGERWKESVIKDLAHACCNAFNDSFKCKGVNIDHAGGSNVPVGEAFDQSHVGIYDVCHTNDTRFWDGASTHDRDRYYYRGWNSETFGSHEICG